MKKYKALEAFDHQGKRVEVGDVVELTKNQAEKLAGKVEVVE